MIKSWKSHAEIVNWQPTGLGNIICLFECSLRVCIKWREDASLFAWPATRLISEKGKIILFLFVVSITRLELLKTRFVAVMEWFYVDTFYKDCQRFILYNCRVAVLSVVHAVLNKGRSRIMKLPEALDETEYWLEFM